MRQRYDLRTPRSSWGALATATAAQMRIARDARKTRQRACSLSGEEKGEVPVRQCLVRYEPYPAGGGEKWAKWNWRGAIAALNREKCTADQRADQRSDQYDRQQREWSHPRAECAEQFEIAIAHAFLAGRELEQPIHRPKAKIAERSAENAGFAVDEQRQQGEQQTAPEQGQGQLIGQQLGAHVDAGERDQGPGES